MTEGTGSQAGAAGRWLDAVAILHLVVTVILVGLLVQSWRIEGNPATATGVVESKKISKGNGEGPDVFTLRYAFQVPSGGQYRGTANVTNRIYDATLVGDPITVQYAVNDPGNSRVLSETGHPRIIEFGLAAVVGLFVFLYFGPRRWLALRRGEPDPTLQS